MLALSWMKRAERMQEEEWLDLQSVENVRKSVLVKPAFFRRFAFIGLAALAKRSSLAWSSG